MGLEHIKKCCSHRFAAGRIRPVCGPVAGATGVALAFSEDGPQGRGYSGYSFIQNVLALYERHVRLTPMPLLTELGD